MCVYHVYFSSILPLTMLQSITVTNFTGRDREYIKKLLLMLGVPYTATMTGKNTVVIAAL